VNDKLVVGVVGAGAMGSGIAQVAAAAGHRVVLGDADPASVPRAKERITKSVAKAVESGKLARDVAEGLVDRIADAGNLTNGYAAYADCGVVIEAIVENLEVKRILFAALEKVVSAECILATNTSSLSIAAIGGATSSAHRVIGIHFFNPPVVMPLVEVIPAITTSPVVTEQATALVKSWKKTVVVASDTPGFIVNRIARPFYGESLRQLEEGVADVATIDWAMRELGGFRMGPFELMDFIGNDVNYAVTTSVFEAFYYDPRYRPALTQRRLVEAGLFGQKTKRGYYDYRDGATKPEPKKDQALGKAILMRTLVMLVNEAIDAVQLGVASVADIELAMTRGVNYPKGLLEWGDSIGGATVLEKLEQLHAEYGEDRYRPSPLLRRRVREGKPLVS
jgi:3-hydroxybutyryl-CoA dehydrogenase